jgi:hypothetical protein
MISKIHAPLSMCLIMFYSVKCFLNTSEQLRSVLPYTRDSVSRLTYQGFRPFPRPMYSFYSFRSTDYFDDLGQSILPILSSEVTAISGMML